MRTIAPTISILDGTDGDDANDGTTEESAVKTFERAKSLLAESKNPVILICGTVTITQDTTWTMADLEGGKVMRAGSFTKRMIVIEPEAEDASATLTLENITLDGGATMWPELLTQNMVWYILDIEAGGRLVLNSARRCRTPRHRPYGRLARSMSPAAALTAAR